MQNKFSMTRWAGLLALPLALGLFGVACSDDDAAATPGPGESAGGSAGSSAGAGGSTAGSAGSTAGSAGAAAGTAGAAGATAGAGGAAAGTAGAAGEAGAAGAAAGAAGEAGAGGAAAGAGGDAGAGGAAAGAGGEAGAAGSGGSAGGSASLFFTATGFVPHEGKRFRIVVLDKAADAAVGNVTVGTIQDGTISLSFIGALEKGKTYTVNYYADAMENGKCDAPGPTSDHVWTRELTADKDEVELTVAHDTNWADVCASFDKTPGGKDLIVSGKGFGVHTGSAMGFALVSKASDAVVAGAVTTKVVLDTFDYTWHGALAPGQQYDFTYFADANNDGACNAPPTDHVWTREVASATDNVTLTIAHDTNWVDVCKYY